MTTLPSPCLTCGAPDLAGPGHPRLTARCAEQDLEPRNPGEKVPGRGAMT